jgi:hypothetical protein
MRILTAFLAGCAMAVLTGTAVANDFATELNDLAAARLKQIAQSVELVDAIKAQNQATEAYDQSKIDELDDTWRAEAEAASQPMIDQTLSTPASKFLIAAREESQGLLTEIFAMDARGLNVAQSDPTSDYWQGDEDKWQQTYMVGPDAVHISDVEQDESTQTLQSQVSMAVVDPDSGAPIGAVTFGVNVEHLP